MPVSKRKYSNKVAVGIAFGIWWPFWMFVQAKVLSNFNFTFVQCLADSVTSNLLLAGICLLIINNMRYYLPGKERYWYVLVVSFALSSVWLLVVRLLLWMLFKDDEKYMYSLTQSSNIRFAFGFLMTGCITMISLLWYTQKEQNVMNDMKRETETLARDAELFKLRQQLQPHFLFNSLNSISALAGNQPEKARHMIQQLSDFLRGTLKRDEQQSVTLEDELYHLQLYLEIEKVRFGQRLQTDIIIEEETKKMLIPSLLLQPIVENAIKFGLYDTIGEVIITIAAKQQDGQLELIITNPFDEETAISAQGTGFGLASIDRRLFLLYTRHGLLKTSKKDTVFTTTILIPQLTI
jgi:two-component system LytT family sensor kinase